MSWFLRYALGLEPTTTEESTNTHDSDNSCSSDSDSDGLPGAFQAATIEDSNCASGSHTRSAIPSSLSCLSGKPPSCTVARDVERRTETPGTHDLASTPTETPAAATGTTLAPPSSSRSRQGSPVCISPLVAKRRIIPRAVPWTKPLSRGKYGLLASVRLKPHQEAAVEIMIAREKNGQNMLLADQMGLGKTVQAIALCEARREAGQAPTLVIMPKSLTPQWRNEIIERVGLEPGSICDWAGANRPRDIEVLRGFSYIIATYDIIAHEYRSYQRWKTAHGVEGDLDLNASLGQEAAMQWPLFFMLFFRVILDEAHRIRNSETVAYHACCAIPSKHRLGLTGTPIQNKVDDLYSLLTFLRVSFVKITRGPAAIAARQTHETTSECIIRRLKDDLDSDGRRILNLPPRTVYLIQCAFDEEELAFYTALHEQIVLKANIYLEEGMVQKFYSYIFVLLLRERQGC